MLTQLHHMIRTGGFMFMVVVAAMCVLGMERAASAQPQTITLRVDINNGSTTGDGSAWDSDAYKFLQDALTASDGWTQDPDVTVHIWVAAGTYRPIQSAFWPYDHCGPYSSASCPTGSRGYTFNLRNNVRLYGGFAGTETMEQERDWETNITILSGDLHDDDDFDAGVSALTFDNYEDNSWHVVIAENVNHSATLDGFVIRGGARAAVLVRDAQPRLMDCVIVSRSGAAVRCAGASFLALIRCVVESRDESCPIEVRDESEAVLVDSTLMPAMPEMIDLGEHDGVRGCRVGTAHH